MSISKKTVLFLEVLIAAMRFVMKKFEERLAHLEDIRLKIKDTALPLEEALTLFEEGIKLAKTLEKDIDKIERRVQILMNQPTAVNEKPELELFAPDGSIDA